MDIGRRGVLALPLALSAAAPVAAQRPNAAVHAAALAAMAPLDAGALLVARRGRVLWAGGIGPAQAGEIPRPGRHTVFDGLSLGKVFTSLALMKLVDAGALDLNARVRAYMPELPESFADLRVRHVINNDTGLPTYLSGEDFQLRTDAEALAEIVAMTPERRAGTGWKYSNVTFQLLGLLLQRLTREPIDRALRRLVFMPAGLTRTGFMSEPRWRAEDVATGWIDGRPTGSPKTWPHTWSLLGAAGIATTVDDLYRLNRTFMVGSALQPATRARLLHTGVPTYNRGPYIGPDTIDISYGAAMFHWLDRAGRHCVFAGGDGEFGFHALTFWRREDDVYIAAMMNSRSTTRPFDRARFVDAVLAALG